MKRSLTFAEILEQKMASGDAPSTSEKAEFRSENGTGRLAAPAQDATTASQLESEFSLAFDWNSLVKAKLSAFYPQAKKGAPTLKIVPKPPPRVTSDPQWPVEKLSAAARLALDKLNIGSPTISSGTLKKAYRRLARKLHPDAGGAPSAEGFLIVQEAFEIVTRELETLAKNIKL